MNCLNVHVLKLSNRSKAVHFQPDRMAQRCFK